MRDENINIDNNVKNNLSFQVFNSVIEQTSEMDEMFSELLKDPNKFDSISFSNGNKDVLELKINNKNFYFDARNLSRKFIDNKLNKNINIEKKLNNLYSIVDKYDDIDSKSKEALKKFIKNTAKNNTISYGDFLKQLEESVKGTTLTKLGRNEFLDYFKKNLFLNSDEDYQELLDSIKQNFHNSFYIYKNDKEGNRVLQKDQDDKPKIDQYYNGVMTFFNTNLQSLIKDGDYFLQSSSNNGAISLEGFYLYDKNNKDKPLCYCQKNDKGDLTFKEIFYESGNSEYVNNITASTIEEDIQSVEIQLKQSDLTEEQRNELTQKQEKLNKIQTRVNELNNLIERDNVTVKSNGRRIYNGSVGINGVMIYNSNFDTFD